jgi:hypothetical protein
MKRRQLLSAACAMTAAVASAQDADVKPLTLAVPLFDAHLHYNDEAIAAGYTPERVAGLFRKQQVGAIISNSRPNQGTQDLAKSVHVELAGTKLVPFVRPYRNREDYTRWHDSDEVFRFVEGELAKGTSAGPYRGIGEGHFYNSSQADNAGAKKFARLAQERKLSLLLHCDDVAIEKMFAHAPQSTIIWAHTGIGGVPIKRVEALLERYPKLMCELSYRPELLGAYEQFQLEWKALFARYASRFLIGSDTWITQRWEYYEDLMRTWRRALGGLPQDQALAIAWNNGAQLFGLAKKSWPV